MPFTFRLQVPLRLARAQRSNVRRELAVAIRARLEAEQAYIAGQQHAEAIGQELMQRATVGIGGAELQTLSRAREAAWARLPRLLVVVRETAEAETEVRARLAAATREMRVLERLRNAAFERWKREIARKEQAQIDDVVLVRHARDLAARAL